MSVEAEMCVLGGAILSSEYVQRAVDALVPEMFTHDKTALIFTKIVDLYWEGRAIDGVILTSELPEHKVTIVRLAEYIPTLRNYGEYLKIVRDAWCAKVLKNALMVMGLRNNTVEEQLQELKNITQQCEALMQEGAGKDVRSFTQAAQELSTWLRSEERNETIHTGFPALDSATGGLIRKSVTVLSARSGKGKTDYAINLALRMAKCGHKVLYFSMEMPAMQLMQRVASYLLQVNSIRIRDKALSEAEITQLERLLREFEKSGKINFVEEPRVSVQRVRHYVDLWKPDAVFIDHVGLMERPNVKDSYRAIGIVSNLLKQLALEKDIAIVELVQMNRQIENRASSKPNLSDLRETGDLEQDADYVAFVVPEDLEGRILRGDDFARTVVHLLKNRYGYPGKFEYQWRPQYHKFLEVETRYG